MAKEYYTLTVEVGEWVEGIPLTGVYTYKKGDGVNYNYSLRSGYNNLEILLDGNLVSSSGSILMDSDRTLKATASEF